MATETLSFDPRAEFGAKGSVGASSPLMSEREDEVAWFMSERMGRVESARE